MDLHLQFGHGKIQGEGNDDIGHFIIRGRYDAKSCECHWTKSYLGQHDVMYKGYREGKGIWGRWEINRNAHGGFHIWPKNFGEETEQHLDEKAPVDAIGQESRVHFLPMKRF